MIEKAMAYVLKTKGLTPQVLVFDHVDFPEAGQQVPSGTVEPNEKPEAALLREIREETGLIAVEIIAYLGKYEFKNRYRNEWQRKHVFLLKSLENTPDEWIHVVPAKGEDHLLRFRCYWMDIDQANLIYDQGDYLKHISIKDLIQQIDN